MRRILLAGAVGVVLAANLWGMLQVSQNQKAPRGGSLELTERELRLLPMAAESTATMLRLDWNVGGTGEERHRAPDWLDRQRLIELGFDCSLPLNSPNARRHYASMPSRPVFLTLEYAGEAWRNAGAKAEAGSRLYVVDAARDADQLRQRYPDVHRYVICRGLLRLSFRDRDRKGNLLDTPRLEGWVEGLRPGEVFVPLPYSRVLRSISRPDFDTPSAGPQNEPRFAVRVCWGANYEPWVEAVRLLKVGKAGEGE